VDEEDGRGAGEGVQVPAQGLSGEERPCVLVGMNIFLSWTEPHGKDVSLSRGIM
jgi:hypothetical protein